MEYVLILGATSDIGRALAHEYARQGCSLYLASRDEKRSRADAIDLGIRYGVDARPVAFDATDCQSHGLFYANLDPRPTGVIWVAGYLGSQDRAQSDFEEARKILETNYGGCVSILNIVADDFEQRRSGFIVGISSVAADRGRQSNYLYGSAKAGLTAYLSGLRNRLHCAGVQVLTVKPGFVNTKMTEDMELPQRLTAEPQEIAGAVFRAQSRGKDVLYAKWFWRYIMLAIMHIPEKIFKRLSL